MELLVLKHGNLMGSPDTKEMLHRAGAGSTAAHALWQDIFRIKRAFDLDGHATSLLLVEPSLPDVFPTAVDFSYITADPASYENAVDRALAGLAEAGFDPREIKSLLVTHPHPDHFDGRLLDHLPAATVYGPAELGASVVEPFDPARFGGLIECLDTPGHGTPHVSFLLELPDLDLAVGIAGDLVMSHAHYLSPEHPLSFADHDAGRRSIEELEESLRSRGRRYRTIFPGHDVPFFLP